MTVTLHKQVHCSDYHPAQLDFHAEVIDGLGQQPKTIAPKFFYDEIGSQLFEAVCHLPEYYLTRSENQILRQNVDNIADVIGRQCCIIEPGSGSSRKIRLLLDALRPCTYMPMDISKQHLLKSAQRLADDYPWLTVHAACADFTRELIIPEQAHQARKIMFFPGSSIGNFDPQDAVAFLRHLRDIAGEDGGLLIGIDLKKDPAILNAAYNDRKGITAQFNKNLLHRINKELGGTFDPMLFRHHAFYNEEPGRIEMHLVSTRRQTVCIAGQPFDFADGESIHTENSYKYTVEEFQHLAAQAGFQPVQSWVDALYLFNVQFFESG